MSEYRSTYANSHALIVGINTYSDPRFVPLGQAEADAQALADLLSTPPYNFQINKLIGHAASRAAILQALFALYRTQPDDRVLVYFAGHGYTLTDRFGSETGYLACADTVPEQHFTALKMDEVTELTRNAGAKHIGFIFDACFSGQALGLTRAPSVSVDKLMVRRAFQVISAGAGDQTVSDFQSMTGEIIQALQSGVLLTDGMITLGELGLYIQQTITADSRQTQIPQFGHLRGSQGGDFVFQIDNSVRLPADLEDGLRSMRGNTRRGAVADLIELVHQESGDVGKLAIQRLAQMAHEDVDERVRQAAQSYFDEIAAGGDGSLTQSQIRAMRRSREITPTGMHSPDSPQAVPAAAEYDTLPYKMDPIRSKPATVHPPHDAAVMTTTAPSIERPDEAISQPSAQVFRLSRPVLIGVGGFAMIVAIGAIVLFALNAANLSQNDGTPQAQVSMTEPATEAVSTSNTPDNIPSPATEAAATLSAGAESSPTLPATPTSTPTSTTDPRAAIIEAARTQGVLVSSSETISFDEQDGYAFGPHTSFRLVTGSYKNFRMQFTLETPEKRDNFVWNFWINLRTSDPSTYRIGASATPETWFAQFYSDFESSAGATLTAFSMSENDTKTAIEIVALDEIGLLRVDDQHHYLDLSELLTDSAVTVSAWGGDLTGSGAMEFEFTLTDFQFYSLD